MNKEEALCKSMRDLLEAYKSRLPILAGQKPEQLPFYFKSESPVTKEVEQSCSLDSISHANDLQIEVFSHSANIKEPIDPVGEKLQTCLALAEHKAKTYKNPFQRCSYNHRLAVQPDPSMGEPLKEYATELTLRFYRPPRASHRYYKVEEPVFAEEFICSGSTTLCELRDRIACICNGRRYVDVSEDPEAPLPVLDTNPGYFFIKNTFYNDDRNPKNCDYSATVIKWAATAAGMNRRSFKSKSMQNVQLMDVEMSCGTPMQYMHHGNCEHLFVASQMEVRTTASNVESYPQLCSASLFNRRSCFMCGMRPYHFIVEKSRHQFHDPSYLCRKCLLSFHYVKGKKVGQFRAYRIYDAASDPDEASAEEVDVADVAGAGEGGINEAEYAEAGDDEGRNVEAEDFLEG